MEYLFRLLGLMVGLALVLFGVFLAVLFLFSIVGIIIIEVPLGIVIYGRLLMSYGMTGDANDIKYGPH